MSYYVYEHWLDGKCIYVGSGNKNRPYSFYRNKEYNDFVEGRRNEICVKIFKKVKSKEDSFIIEKELTEERMKTFYLFNKKSGNFPHETLKKQVSNKLKNHEMTEETKKKISNTLKGRPFGKHTEDAKMKMKIKAIERYKRFICLNFKGEIFIFKHMTDLLNKMDELGLSKRMGRTAMRTNVSYPKTLIKNNIYIITDNFLDELDEKGKGNVL